jgi:hypothetical protein
MGMSGSRGGWKKRDENAEKLAIQATVIKQYVEVAEEKYIHDLQQISILHEQVEQVKIKVEQEEKSEKQSRGQVMPESDNERRMRAHKAVMSELQNSTDSKFIEGYSDASKQFIDYVKDFDTHFKEDLSREFGGQEFSAEEMREFELIGSDVLVGNLGADQMYSANLSKPDGDERITSFVNAKPANPEDPSSVYQLDICRVIEQVVAKPDMDHLSLAILLGGKARQDAAQYGQAQWWKREKQGSNYQTNVGAYIGTPQFKEKEAAYKKAHEQNYNRSDGMRVAAVTGRSATRELVEKHRGQQALVEAYGVDRQSASLPGGAPNPAYGGASNNQAAKDDRNTQENKGPRRR